MLCLTSFSWREALLRTIYSGRFWNGSFSFPSANSTGEFALIFYCGNPVELLEVDLTILWRGPPMTGSLWVLNSLIGHSELPTICELRLRFSYPSSGSQGGFCFWVCSNKLFSLCLTILGTTIFLSMDPGRCWWFFLVCWALLVRMQRQLPSPSQAELETSLLWFYI